MIGKYDLINMY